MGFFSGDLPGRFDPVKLGHADIENGNLRMVFRDKLDRFPPIAGLRYYLEIGLLIEQQTQARPNDGVIVSEEDSNLWHGLIARILHHLSTMLSGLRRHLVTPHAVKQIDRAKWPYMTLHDIMRPLDDLRAVAPDASLTSALESMSRYDLNQLPVISNKHLEGVLSRAQVLSYLQTHAELKG